MAAHDFHLTSLWRIEAPIAEIAAILQDPERFPAWWGEVYLGVSLLEKGDPNGIGQRVAIHSRGWLPYHLNWIGTLVENDSPHRWALTATGDLTGRGEWVLTQQGATAEVRFDWRVAADRPLFRRLAPLLGPLMAWNHRWAMARGEAGLRRELIRRRQPGG